MEIKLSEEEVNLLKVYKDLLENSKSSLGSLRQQYLVSEKKLIVAMEKAESDFMANLRILAQNKGITDDTWSFDLSTFSFIKKD